MKEIALGVVWLPVSFVNVYFVGERGQPWVLVDTGMPGRSQQIVSAAEEIYGAHARPEAIILTHGHFDHAGSVLDLADIWSVPVYAHRLEMPYLTGQSDYPPPDPTIGGFMAFLSRFLPSAGIDLGDRIHELPPNGEVPGLPAWDWHFTPGHTPGHISLFRRADKTLLVGDAFATTNYDSFMAAATQKQEIARGGSPFTSDWMATWRSVAHLAGLTPFTVACGHGIPMTGASVDDQLWRFVRKFPVPSHGRYALAPARTGENGVESLPPAPPDPMPKIVAGVGMAAIAGATLLAARRRKRETEQEAEGSRQ